nr:integrase, catalytic region, zinc finger, CCHC-type, peptidase aspartic, catalytic [Tanacetum cinerariifolium]
GQDNAIDGDVDEQPIQDLALNVENVFQADDCDAFDSNVDEAPMAQTMFMANLSSADPVNDEARPSYDSDILSESIGAGVEPLELGFEFDDQEWVEMGSFLFVRLEMRSRGFKDSIFLLIIVLGTY